MSAADDLPAQIRKVEQEKRRLANARAALMHAKNWSDADEKLAAHQYVEQLNEHMRLLAGTETRVNVPDWVIRHLVRSYYPTNKERG